MTLNFLNFYVTSVTSTRRAKWHVIFFFPLSKHSPLYANIASVYTSEFFNFPYLSARSYRESYPSMWKRIKLRISRNVNFIRCRSNETDNIDNRSDRVPTKRVRGARCVMKILITYIKLTFEYCTLACMIKWRVIAFVYRLCIGICVRKFNIACLRRIAFCISVENTRTGDAYAVRGMCMCGGEALMTFSL